MHKTILPSILYFGTPVVLISSLNEDRSTNLSPMSSAWWLGWSCMLGLDASSRTTENLRREKECVLNLASTENVDQVDKLALLSGSTSLPRHKQMLGYSTCTDKFKAAGLTGQPSETVRPLRIEQCPIQMEAIVQNIHEFARYDEHLAIPTCAIEVRINKIHIEKSLIDEKHPNRINPNKWRPLIMSFRHFFGLSGQIHSSRLGLSPEEMYATRKNQ